MDNLFWILFIFSYTNFHSSAKKTPLQKVLNKFVPAQRLCSEWFDMQIVKVLWVHGDQTTMAPIVVELESVWDILQGWARRERTSRLDFEICHFRELLQITRVISGIHWGTHVAIAFGQHQQSYRHLQNTGYLEHSLNYPFNSGIAFAKHRFPGLSGTFALVALLLDIPPILWAFAKHRFARVISSIRRTTL